jgi:N-acetyl-anhydromuramyl-L-alanine amidase AmpD
VGRGGRTPIWIVIHDMEASEFSGRAESTAAYFANPDIERNVSSHYCVDDDSVIQCVLLKDTAWTVGNTPGNQRGINWELAGFARQTRAEWLDAFGINMFRQMVPIVQADCAEYDIPFRKLTIDDLKAFRPGFTSHNDLRVAFNVTTHTDPGPAFPWDVFLQMMMEGDVSLTTKQDARLNNNSEILGALAWGRELARNLKRDDGTPAGDIDLNNYYNKVAGRVIEQLVAGGYVIPPGTGGGTLVEHTHEGTVTTGPAVPST